MITELDTQGNPVDILHRGFENATARTDRGLQQNINLADTAVTAKKLAARTGCESSVNFNAPEQLAGNRGGYQAEPGAGQEALTSSPSSGPILARQRCVYLLLLTFIPAMLFQPCPGSAFNLGVVTRCGCLLSRYRRHPVGERDFPPL